MTKKRFSGDPRQLRFVAILSVMIIITIAGYMFVWSVEKKRLISQMESQSRERGELITHIFQLLNESIKNFVFDYTFYDEMVNLVKTGGKKWAKDNLDPGLQTFRVNALWVYNPEGNLIYSTNNIGSKSIEQIPIPRDKIKELFRKSPFTHFFCRIEEGLIEIEGATIHPTFDIDRKTTPQGFFFVGRLWDDKFLLKVNKLTDSKFYLYPYGGQKPEIGFKSENDIDYFVYSQILYGWDNLPIVFLSSQSQTTILKESKRLAAINFAFLLVFSLFLLLYISYYFYALVLKPLRKIQDCLYTGNTSDLDDMSKESQIFAELADLIKKFSSQRESLIREVFYKEKLEKEVKASQYFNSVLFHTSSDALFILSQDATIVDCNSAASEMSGYKKEELLKKSFFELLTNESKERIFELFNPDLHTDYSVSHFQIKKKNGETLFAYQFNLKTIDSNSYLVIVKQRNASIQPVGWS